MLVELSKQYLVIFTKKYNNQKVFVKMRERRSSIIIFYDYVQN